MAYDIQIDRPHEAEHQEQAQDGFEQPFNEAVMVHWFSLPPFYSQASRALFFQ